MLARGRGGPLGASVTAASSSVGYGLGVVVEQPATAIAIAIASEAARTVIGRPACAAKGGIVDLRVHQYDSRVAAEPRDVPIDPARLDALLEDARATLPDVRLLTDPLDRESYRLDETG